MIFNLRREKDLKDLSDKELLVQYQSGKDARFAGELFSRYAPLVFGTCRKYIKQKEDCRDISMDVFEKMLTSIESTDIFVFKKWLLSITRNSCLSFLRNQEKIPFEQEDWKEIEKKSEIFMENDGFLRLVSRGSFEQQLNSAINQLKPEQKRCMELFFYDNLSYKAIEEKTEYTIKQIKSFLQNGKRKVKLILERGQFTDTH